jgi:class 3 adenylate cyclase
MPDPSQEFARYAANAAIRFVRYLEHRNASHPIQWTCRIGIAAGPVIGSVVGVQKYIYDVFGPAVVEASRLRYHARPMGIVGNRPFADGIREVFGTMSLGAVDGGAGGREEIFALAPSLKIEQGAG